MGVQSWLQFAALVVALAVSTPLLGRYLARTFADGASRRPLDAVFVPVERVMFRLLGADPDREQRWTAYAYSLLAFSVVSVLGLYLLQRLQGVLALNPTGAPAPGPALAFNTAVSFVTNTNWQNYSGETQMAYLTQALGLSVQNFVSAGVGLCVAVALIRGIARRRSRTIGNFWADLVRSCLRVLAPLALFAAVVLVSQGVVQNWDGFTRVRTLDGTTQQLPGGPVAGQEAIKQLGTNGGGFYNANSAHPFENPTPFTNLFEVWLLLVIPFALVWAYGELVGDLRQGLAVGVAMLILWAASSVLTMQLESQPNPKLTARGAAMGRTATQAGGNAEGKEVRFGPAGSGMFAAATTGTSTGAVNSTHDSYLPLGGMLPLLNMMLGEVSPGGVGAGLYGMLVFAILAVFIAGLMVGRTPEYLGKKIEPSEMKLVVLWILVVPLVVLACASIAVLLPQAVHAAQNAPGPHGLTEIVYAYTSAGNNNGSAFAGLSANTTWFNLSLGVCMLAGRFLLIVPVLAIAGSLARKQPAPVTAGTFPTNTPTFTVLLIGVVLIVVGLTYFPVLSLGPIVEQLQLGR